PTYYHNRLFSYHHQKSHRLITIGGDNIIVTRVDAHHQHHPVCIFHWLQERIRTSNPEPSRFITTGANLQGCDRFITGVSACIVGSPCRHHRERCRVTGDPIVSLAEKNHEI
ncbi:unnamed protein product, partial [Brassica oleracea]